jgi:uncharacterized protein
MSPRKRHLERCTRLLHQSPCLALLGARPVGKTTLAGEIARGWSGPVHQFDLERPSDLARLSEPELALEPLDGLIVLDEIQRRPDIFPVLRSVIDRHPGRRYPVLGSAAPELLHQSSETLAGRIAFHDLGPLALDEVGAEALDELWLRGGFPRSFTAIDDDASFRWRLDFIRTFVERDLPTLGSRVPSTTTDRLWRMPRLELVDERRRPRYTGGRQRLPRCSHRPDQALRVMAYTAAVCAGSNPAEGTQQN